jgi:hypothetical protein
MRPTVVRCTCQARVHGQHDDERRDVLTGSGDVPARTDGRVVDNSFGSTCMPGRTSRAFCLEIKGVGRCWRGSSLKREKIDGGETVHGNSGEGGEVLSARGVVPRHGLSLEATDEGRERSMGAVDGEAEGENRAWA